MKTINIKSFKNFYKAPIFGLIFGFIFYMLVGFILIPPFAKSEIIKTINNKFNKTAIIEKVSFNPFVFTVSIQGFILDDAKYGEVLKCNEIFIDLKMLPLLKKEIDIDSFEIY
ncbi:MAG: hypothetical protein PF445_08775, partial [Melioribacteraceae bacterium]|nr:hypothetical protein [Melioribacteraceae bacterium]